MVVFTDDSWPDGEERSDLMWDYIEVPGLYLTLQMGEGENTEYMEKDMIRKMDFFSGNKLV